MREKGFWLLVIKPKISWLNGDSGLKQLVISKRCGDLRVSNCSSQVPPQTFQITVPSIRT